MSEIEVGEYVRTKTGEIHKIKTVETRYIEFEDGFGVPVELKEYIKKHSKNIIDLIEVGDYVNGHLIVKIRIDPFTKKKQLFTEHWEYNWQGDGTLVVFYDEDIKTILTQESYMANCYKVGGEDE